MSLVREDIFENYSLKTDNIETDAILNNAMTARSLVTETGVDNYCGKMVYWLEATPTLSGGNTTVANNANNLYVTIYAYDGFQEVENNVKVWVGLNSAFNDLTNSGTVRPTEDQYQYKATAPSGNFEYSYTVIIPLVDIDGYDPGQCSSQYIYVIANAEVLVPNGDGTFRGESAYGGYIEVPGDAWWYYLKYLPECCVEPPEYEYTSETAFSYGTHVFVATNSKKANPEWLLGLGLTKNRWGWAINLTEDGEYTYKVYAGAGLNRLSRATEVGEMTVTLSGSSVLVEYNLYK